MSRNPPPRTTTTTRHGAFIELRCSNEAKNVAAIIFTQISDGIMFLSAFVLNFLSILINLYEMLSYWTKRLPFLASLEQRSSINAPCLLVVVGGDFWTLRFLRCCKDLERSQTATLENLDSNHTTSDRTQHGVCLRSEGGASSTALLWSSIKLTVPWIRTKVPKRCSLGSSPLRHWGLIWKESEFLSTGFPDGQWTQEEWERWERQKWHRGGLNSQPLDLQS